MTQLTDSMNKILTERQGTIDESWIVIMDFGLVLGIDSSAAEAMVKLKNTMQSQYKIELCVFVSGTEDGFPTEFDLTRGLSASSSLSPPRTIKKDIETQANELTSLLNPHTQANERTSILNPPKPATTNLSSFFGSHVCDSLDTALVISENALIAKEDPSLLEDDLDVGDPLNESSTLSEERIVAIKYLANICPAGSDRRNIEKLFGALKRETYAKDEFVWKQGSSGDSVKLIVRGMLVALLENEAGTSELISTGNTIGELGLVEGIDRMSSVKGLSDEAAVLYSLSREDFERMIRDSPQVARLVDLMCVRYLSARVQHVSNRVFETRYEIILLVFAFDYQLADTFSNLSLHFTFADAYRYRLKSANYNIDKIDTLKHFCSIIAILFCRQEVGSASSRSIVGTPEGYSYRLFRWYCRCGSHSFASPGRRIFSLSLLLTRVIRAVAVLLTNNILQYRSSHDNEFIAQKEGAF
jgi:CRP-like cAMP-binding protein